MNAEKVIENEDEDQKETRGGGKEGRRKGRKGRKNGRRRRMETDKYTYTHEINQSSVHDCTESK